jgi:hypothetical protein
MDKKRLQEIKDKHILKDGVEWTNQEDIDTENIIKELITAYEQAQAELAKAQGNLDLGDGTIRRLRDTMRGDAIDIHDLRAQVTDLYLTKDREIDNLRAQLTTSKEVAYDEHLALEKVKKQLAEAQAERDTYKDRWKEALERIEYWKYEMPELRPDEL